MKKIILIFIIATFLITAVSAFSAQRAITATDVTIDIDVTGTTGYIVDETLPSGVTPSNIGQGGVYNSGLGIIRWTKLDNSFTSLTYSYTGSGTVSGTITGGDPASTQTITGDTVLGSTTPSPTIKINEVEANPEGTDSGNEWVELYNPNSYSVDLTGWKIIDSGDTETILSGTIASEGYLLITSGLSIVNADEVLRLTDDGDNIIDTTPSLSDSSNNDNTNQRVPDGASSWEFKTQTAGATNSESSEPPEELIDDLMPNYITGQIILDEELVPIGTQFQVEVLNGANAGYVYTGQVGDSNLITPLRRNGNYHTGDKIGFSTGARFRLSLPSVENCDTEAIFENGGNTGVILDCASVVDEMPPVITLISPVIGAIFDTIRNIDFTFTATDETANNLRCELYTDIQGSFSSVRSTTIVSGNTGTFSLTNIPDGNYIWNVQCSDSQNSAFATQDYSFTMAAPDSPVFALISNKIVEENSTLEFTVSVNDQDGDNLTLSATNLPENAVFETATGIASVSQTFIFTPNFTQSGNYNILFIAEDSTGLTTEKTVSITVTDFEFPPEFSDAEQCSLKNNNIKITIKEPDDGEDFEIGETIEVELKIENKFNEDLDFDYEVHLYDLDEEESIEEIKDDVDIDEEDHETVDLEIEIPYDLDEHNDFAIYVYVEDEEDRCNSAYNEIELEREDDILVIKDIEIYPTTAELGDFIEFIIEVENIGSDDQDAEIRLTNSELGLNLVSDEFEIEKYGEDDKITKYFSFQIPEDAESGEYEIDIEVSYSGEKTTKKQVIYISEETPLSYYQRDGVIYLGQQATTSRPLVVSDIYHTPSRPLTVSEIEYIDYDQAPQDVETTPKPRQEIKKVRWFSYSGIIEELNDPIVRTLLMILAIVLAIGIVVFFILIIIWLGRR